MGEATSPSDWSFDSLRLLHPGRDYVNTLAYWLGLLFKSDSTFSKNAKEACGAMSYHYDVEEQVLDIAELRSSPEIIPSVFLPIAPVSLALKWSPFPAACEALGTPVYHDMSEGHALAHFFPLHRPTFVAKTPDERHFQFLLNRTCERAEANAAKVFLCGSPGWSYKDECLADFIKEDTELKTLMEKFGYVFCGRKPKTSEAI